MQTAERYLDYSDRDDRLSGGSRRIPIDTPIGRFTVWTKRVGNNPDLKLLLLHGGPGATSEYFEAFDSYLPAASVEYYYYDQLGSGRSDQPDDPSLWELDRFVDEVEQVRQSLGLDRDTFVLLGHSWGGILAIEYALAHQDHLRGLVISNMMASAPAYSAYAAQVLMPAMDPAVLAEIQALEAAGDTEDPRYEELLIPHYYEHHILRMPAAEWPDPVQRAFAHINRQIYVPMQGPSELGMSADAKLATWDRVDDLARIEVPTLVIGARHDTMDPAHMEMMAGRLPKGQYLYCARGSHMAVYDDQDTYVAGLIDFLRLLRHEAPEPRNERPNGSSAWGPAGRAVNGNNRSPGAVLDALLRAVKARNLPATLACFALQADPTVMGSESGELARGQEAVEAFFVRIYGMSGSYQFHLPNRVLATHGEVAWMVLRAPSPAVVTEKLGV
jgi:proline iminopeptidase